jgi:hypothetical protein
VIYKIQENISLSEIEQEYVSWLLNDSPELNSESSNDYATAVIKRRKKILHTWKPIGLRQPPLKLSVYLAMQKTSSQKNERH